MGAAGNYATLTAALADIANKEMTGAVTLELAADYVPASETFPVTFGVYAGASGTNLLTVKPASGTTHTITATSASSIFKFNGADYVVLDGSNNGSTSRDITVENTSTGASSAVIWVASLGANAGATNNTIKNLNVKAGSITASTYGIFVGGASVATSGDHNNNVTIQNNAVSKAYYGIYNQGTTTGANTGLLITQNVVGSNTATDYKLIKVFICRSNAAINNAMVFNIKTVGSISNAGIELVRMLRLANLVRDVESNSASGYGYMNQRYFRNRRNNTKQCYPLDEYNKL